MRRNGNFPCTAASFTTAGIYNRKNTHYWSSSNPYKKQVVRIQGRRNVLTWCSIKNNKVLGPIFVEAYNIPI